MPPPPTQRAPAQSSLVVPAFAAGVIALFGWFVYTRFSEPAVPQPHAAPSASSPTSPGSDGAAPPMPYRLAGMRTQNGATEYLLEEGGRVFAVTAGMIVDGRYRVDALSASAIALVHLPTGTRQSVPMTQAHWPPRTEVDGVAGAAAQAVRLPPTVSRPNSPALQELAR